MSRERSDLPDESDESGSGGQGNLGRRAGRGSLVTISAQLFRLLVTLLGTVLLSRLVAPSAFGVIAISVAVVGIGQMVVDLGLTMAALQARSLSRKVASNLFWINASVGITMCAGVILLAPTIAHVFGEPELVKVLRWLAVMLACSGLAAQFRVDIARNLRFARLAITDVVPVTLGIVLAVCLATYGYGLDALMAQHIVTAVGGLLLSALFTSWRPGLPGRDSATVPFLRFGLYHSLTQFIGYTTRNFDRLALGYGAVSETVGQYDRAYQLSVAPADKLNSPLTKVAVPVLSKASVTGEYERLLQRAQLVACYATAPGLLLIAALSGPLVSVLLGPGWELAGVLLGVLSISAMFRALSQISYWMFISQGLAKQQFFRFLVVLPLVAGAMLLGLRWGAEGVAVGGTIGYALSWIISLVWAARATNVELQPLLCTCARSSLLFGIPGAAAAMFIPTYLDLNEPVHLLVGALLAGLTYGLSFAVFKRVRQDILVLWRIGAHSLRRK